jgi:hypothetical protein
MPIVSSKEGLEEGPRLSLPYSNYYTKHKSLSNWPLTTRFVSHARGTCGILNPPQAFGSGVGDPVIKMQLEADVVQL